MTCPKCGKENSGDAKFCISCGASLGTEVRTTTQVSSYVSPFPLADIGSRIVAGLIDYIILGIISAVVFFLALAPMFMIRGPFGMMGQGWSPPGFGWGWIGGIFLLQFFFWIVYFTYFEGTSGQTFGKKLAHIKVVKDDGSKCDFMAALIRNILRILDRLPFIYIVGIILILVTNKKQRLGDMLAKTIVVKNIDG
ncbi:RDD family protein [[Eubacterium] cellulosolvens]